jgi:hypothetical protein
MKCKHYKGDGYIFKVGKETFFFCDNCTEKLREQMVKQYIRELEMEFKFKKDMILRS